MDEGNISINKKPKQNMWRLFSTHENWLKRHKNQEYILYTYSRRINTTVWLHYLDSNETLGEKAGWELLKEAACCLQQILEVAAYKTAAVQPLTSHPSKMSKPCW